MKIHPIYRNILVTKQGEVFRNNNGNLKKLKQTNTDQGYLTVTVQTSDNLFRKIRVHRLVLETYDTVKPDSERWECDHIDCNKTNNNFGNLEWVTSKENKKRAWENNLYDECLGENNHMTDFEERDVHDICGMIQDGIRNKDIAEIYSVDASTISQIRRGKNWKHISDLYTLSTRRCKRKSKEFIIKICELIRDGSANDEIFEIMDGKISKYDITRIINKVIHKKISDSYF